MTLIGLALRLANFGESLLGDELSTFWILDGNSLGDVLSSIKSDDEITPPLYFVLSWLSLKLGPDPEWVRLPSLIAGTATIPLVYLLGARTIGKAAGVVGAAVMALSPFMIYYSTEARSYALMIALLTASTLAMLAALRTGRTRWWVAYAACSCGALYSHYTAVFPLAAQFAWALWTHREAIRSLLLANLAVLVGFAPWIPGYVADQESPTTNILYALQPFTPDAVRLALENWALGYPYVSLGSAPGDLAVVLITTGVAIAAIAGSVRAWRWFQGSRRESTTTLRKVSTVSPGVVLVAMLALATPVGEAIYSALGPDLLGARALNASWPGLAVSIGAIVTAAGGWTAVACTALVLAGFAIGAIKTLGSELARPDFKGAAAWIEERWGPGDIVVDAAALTPVPQTGLDVYLPQSNPEYRLNLPVSDHPFMVGDRVPPPERLIKQALERGKGRSIFVMTYGPDVDFGDPGKQVTRAEREKESLASKLLREAEGEYEVTDQSELPGLAPLRVIELDSRDASD